MTTLTISLPESLKEFIDQEVETKGYGNVSEYVRGLLREAQAREADARLEALLIDGLTGGDDIRLSKTFWNELRRDAARMIAEQRQGKRSENRSRRGS
jgi:antitoxin ParD1/3/4